jgi:hypothetical protein
MPRTDWRHGREEQRDGHGTVRHLCGLVLGVMVLTGCSAESGQIRQLKSSVPQERLQAVRWLARHGSPGSLNALVEVLDDRDGAVRWAAAEALRERTGQSFGYQAGDTPQRRQEAIARWRQWLRDEGIAPPTENQPDET